MNTLLKGVNLYLIGMMGSGKTTVGRAVAKQLGYRFFDTDAVIEQAAGQSVSEIFAASGEAAFRQLETQVLGQLSAYTRLAIATGGGIVLSPKNWSYLRHGIIVWLDLPVNQLYHRVKGGINRPLLEDPNPQQKLQTILEQRESLYAQADVRVMVNPRETAEQVAQQVLEEVTKVLKPQQPQAFEVDAEPN